MEEIRAILKLEIKVCPLSFLFGEKAFHAFNFMSESMLTLKLKISFYFDGWKGAYWKLESLQP